MAHRRIVDPEMGLALIAAAEKVDDLVDRVDEKDDYVAKHPRAP